MQKESVCEYRKNDPPFPCYKITVSERIKELEEKDLRKGRIVGEKGGKRAKQGSLPALLERPPAD